MWKRKPKRWIERMPLNYYDFVSNELLRRYGFEEYCKQGMILWAWDHNKSFIDEWRKYKHEHWILRSSAICLEPQSPVLACNFEV